MLFPTRQHIALNNLATLLLEFFYSSAMDFFNSASGHFIDEEYELALEVVRREFLIIGVLLL